MDCALAETSLHALGGGSVRHTACTEPYYIIQIHSPSSSACHVVACAVSGSGTRLAPAGQCVPQREGRSTRSGWRASLWERPRVISVVGVGADGPSGPTRYVPAGVRAAVVFFLAGSARGAGSRVGAGNNLATCRCMALRAATGGVVV